MTESFGQLIDALILATKREAIKWANDVVTSDYVCKAQGTNKDLQVEFLFCDRNTTRRNSISKSIDRVIDS